MVRTITCNYVQGDVKYCEFSGLSTDTKPEGVATGSIFTEVDTGDVYFYDEVSEEWTKQFSFQEE